MRGQRLRTRFLRVSVLVTAVTVLVFMAGTLIHLRYGMKQAMDQQLDALGPDILTQIGRQGAYWGQDELPVILTLFDEKNLIRLLKVETAAGNSLYTREPYAELLEKYALEREEDLEDGVLDEPRQTLWFEGRSWRVGEHGDGEHRILLAADLARLDQSLWQVMIAFVFALPIAIAGAAIASLLLARQASDAIEKLTVQAASVTASHLEARIKLGPAPLEVLQLGDILNRMMDRLQRSFQQARRFSADASHELKSPLTVMQGTLENRLSEADDAAPTREEGLALLEETLRMRAIVEGLLVLAKADEGSLLRKRERIDLAALIRELIEDTAVLAESIGASLETHLPADLPGVFGDPLLLRLALHNLLSNAVKHCREGGRIGLQAQRKNAQVVIRISNTGQPIPIGARERIFDRFYRVGLDRPRGEGGLGLGLNIAREVARAHGGDVTLGPSTNGTTTFVVWLTESGK